MDLLIPGRWLRLFALAVLLDPGAASAQVGPLGVQSVVPIVLDVRNDGRTPQRVDLRLQKGGPHLPCAMLVTEARLAGKADSFDRAFAFGPPRAASASGISVPISIDLNVARFAGIYTVKVRPLFDAAVKVDTPAELSIQFVRPPAKVAELPDLLLERDFLTGAIATQHLTLTETSGDAYARFPGIVAVKELRGSLGQSVPATLELRSDGVLPSGGNLVLTPSLSGDLPLGTHTGTVRFDSPQLAAPIEMKLRLVNAWPLWSLPACIVFFIGMGILYRKVVLDRQALEQAQLEAQRVLARLMALQAAQADKALRREIAGEIEKLAAAIDEGASAEAIQKAASDAGAAVDKLVQDAAAQRKQLRDDIVKQKGLLARSGPLQPALRQLVDRAQADFDRMIEAVDGGELDTQKGLLTARVAQLQQDLQVHLQQFATTAGLTLQRSGSWLGASDDFARVDALRTQAEQLPPTTSADELLTHDITLWSATDILLSRTLRATATQAGEAVLRLLGVAPLSATATTLSDAHDALLRFDMAGRTDTVYINLASLLGDYRGLIVDILRQRAKSAKVPEATLDAFLEKGDFAAAAKEIADAELAAAANAPKVEGFGPTKAIPPAALMRSFAGASPLLLKPLPMPGPMLSLVGPTAAQRGEVVVFQAVLAAPVDAAMTLEWTVQGGVAAREHTDDLEFSFVPQTLGPIVVRCLARHANLGAGLSAQASVLVQPSAADQSVLVLKKRVDQREVLISAISGFFIAGFGTLIFMDGFTGTWRDFIYAAVWGFTADVSAARLRTLAEPVSSRTVPAAPATK